MPIEEIVKWVFVALWVTVIFITVVVEISTVGIISGLAAVAAAFGLLIALLWGEHLWTIALQVGVVFTLWGFGYLTLYKVLKSFVQKRGGKYQGSVEDFVGKEYELLKTSYEFNQVTEPYGKIQIQDKFFRTLSENHQGTIIKGTLVKVVKIEGNTFYIKKVVGK